MMIAYQLNALESSGLIRLAQTQSELEYLFRHALVHDAAYGSLVKPDRRQLHRAVGEVLERVYVDGGSNGDLAAVLARHFDEAGDDARALKYFIWAGDQSASRYANAEAVMHYTRAVEITKQASDSGDAAQLSHLYLSRGQALELRALHREALANYLELEALAQTRGDQTMELSALMARAKIHATLNPEQDPAQAQSLLEQALSLARALGDRAAEGKVLWNLMLLHLWSGGDQRRAVAYGEASLTLARELNLPEQVAFNLNDLAYGYMSIGRWSDSRAALDESRGLWRELDNLPMLADNLANSVLLHLRAGDYQPAIDASEDALRISRTIGNVWGQAGSQSYVGLVYLERGEPDRAIAIMEEAIRLGDQVVHPAPTVATRCDLGWVYGLLGDFGRAFGLVDRARQIAGETPFLRAMPLAVRARLYLMNGDLAAADSALQEGYRELKPEGLQWFAPMLLPLAEAELALARRDYARALARIDDLLDELRGSRMRYLLADALYIKGLALLESEASPVQEADQILAKARAEAETLGSRRILWRILVALSELEARRDNRAQAESLIEQARRIIEYIADHAGTLELRVSFLSLPDVRAVIGTD